MRLHYLISTGKGKPTAEMRSRGKLLRLLEEDFFGVGTSGVCIGVDRRLMAKVLSGA
jgi:hypothetical protein